MLKRIHLFLVACLTVSAQTRPVPVGDADTSKKAQMRVQGDAAESTSKKAERSARGKSASSAEEAVLNLPVAKEGLAKKGADAVKEHTHLRLHGHTKHSVPVSAPPAPFAPPESSGSGGSYITMMAVCALIVCCIGVVFQTCLGDVSAYWSSLSSYGTQIGSFAVLVCVQSVAILLFKLCQTSGSYSFSPASCVALTEACKLALAVTLHSRHVQATGASPLEGVTPRICAHYLFLAVLYTVNNQLTFYALEVRRARRPHVPRRGTLDHHRLPLRPACGLLVR